MEYLCSIFLLLVLFSCKNGVIKKDPKGCSEVNETLFTLVNTSSTKKFTFTVKRTGTWNRTDNYTLNPGEEKALVCMPHTDNLEVVGELEEK
ncbi:MAG: hypothetical protein H7329_19595 [Opitutaceae bacterium]|nr:hypothetical protein [Cytophagales bacterium]